MRSMLPASFIIQPPMASTLAGRHLSQHLAEKRKARLQASSTLLLAFGPAAIPLLLCFFVWLHPSVPAVIQVGLFVLLQHWGMIWLLCNQDGLSTHERCQWNQSFASSSSARRWTSFIQCWLLHKYALFFAASLILILYLIPPSAEFLADTSSAVNHPAVNSNVTIAQRALLVTISLFLAQWLYLAKTHYLYVLSCSLFFSTGLFYGGTHIGALIILLQCLAGWIITIPPLRPHPTPNDEHWLKYSFSIRLLLGAARKNPALWFYPLALFSLLLAFIAGYVYFSLTENIQTLLLCQIIVSILIIAILWRARQQWAKTLTYEGAYMLSLASSNMRFSQQALLIPLMGLPAILLLWVIPRWV